MCYNEVLEISHHVFRALNAPHSFSEPNFRCWRWTYLPAHMTQQSQSKQTMSSSEDMSSSPGVWTIKWKEWMNEIRSINNNHFLSGVSHVLIWKERQKYYWSEFTRRANSNQLLTFNQLLTSNQLQIWNQLLTCNQLLIFHQFLTCNQLVTSNKLPTSNQLPVNILQPVSKI